MKKTIFIILFAIIACTAFAQSGTDAVTVSGFTVNLGTFTGTTIPDDVTVKDALQSLETAVESIVFPVEFVDISHCATFINAVY